MFMVIVEFRYFFGAYSYLLNSNNIFCAVRSCLNSDVVFSTTNQWLNSSIVFVAISYTPASNLGYLAPPRTIFHGCQIVHWDPLDGKRRCPQKNLVWAM